jgi:hypothetical protein
MQESEKDLRRQDLRSILGIPSLQRVMYLRTDATVIMTLARLSSALLDFERRNSPLALCTRLLVLYAGYEQFFNSARQHSAPVYQTRL